jgi:hypothetical protein
MAKISWQNQKLFLTQSLAGWSVGFKGDAGASSKFGLFDCCWAASAKTTSVSYGISPPQAAGRKTKKHRHLKLNPVLPMF